MYNYVREDIDILYYILKLNQSKESYINIRTMTINDHDDVFAVWCSYKGMGFNNVDDSKDGIKKFLKQNPNTCFIAEIDGSIIGAIIFGNDGRR